MADYIHGIRTPEQPTSLVPPVQVDTAFPVVFGTAPVHTLEGPAPVNSPKLIASQTEFVQHFGAVPEGESAHDYTLAEFAQVYFGSYHAAPVAFVNVFDPARHRSEGPAGPEGQAHSRPDVSQVKALDIIGGIDGATLAKTGLELTAEVFPRFRMVPGQLLAPGFSGDPSVALALGTKCNSINSHFKANGIIDIPDEVANWSEAPAWLQDNNLTDKNLIAMFGNCLVGEAVQWGSSHLAGVIAQRDAENQGIPFWSPSNKRLLANGLIHGGRELVLGSDEAQWLNGRGIVTGNSFIGGLNAWGNRTAAYPGVTDPRETFIPVRRMFNWVSNTLVLTAWQMLDSPIRRRMVESVVDTFNSWLNGLQAREYILGGRVTFDASENPTTDLMDGIVRFHVYLTPPSPAREFVFTLEYDPDYFSTLFSE